jgi:hypothetical protein
VHRARLPSSTATPDGAATSTPNGAGRASTAVSVSAQVRAAARYRYVHSSAQLAGLGEDERHVRPADLQLGQAVFAPGGVRFPLVDRGRGRDPQTLRGGGVPRCPSPPPRRRPAVPARTRTPRAPNGRHGYKLRRDPNGRSENHGLRVAMARAVPLIWFYGLKPGVFHG